VKRYIGWGKETSGIGTPVPATVYKDLKSESLVPKRNMVFLGDSRYRSPYRKVSTAPTIEGNIVCGFVAEPDADMFYYLMGAVGADDETPIHAGVYQHDITPADALTDSFTTRIGVEEYERVIAGCAVTRMQVNMIVREPMLSWTASLLACSEDKADLGEPDFGAVGEFQWHQGTIKIADTPNTNVRAIRLNMANSMALDRMYAIKATGGNKFSRIDTGEFIVDGLLDMYFTGADEYVRFLGETPYTLNFKFEGATIGATDHKYTLEFVLPSCYTDEDSVPHIDTNAPFRLAVPFKALYDSGDGYIIKTIITNTEDKCPE
jgi:hypothetical protein